MSQTKTESTPLIEIEKYGGKQVAIWEDRVVASGKTLKELINNVKKSGLPVPLSKVRFFSVPKTLAAVYYA